MLLKEISPGARKIYFSKQTHQLRNMHQSGYFYITTNSNNTVLYCGATNDLYKRMQEHKNGIYHNSFTARYNIDKLVYFEAYSMVSDAFTREKQIKAGSRKKKTILIESINPDWNDLFDVLVSGTAEELIRIKKFLR